MNALVVYDSNYGHTAQIAQSIAAAAGCLARHVVEVAPADLETVDLLVVGSPTNGGWMTEKLRDWLNTPLALNGRRVAAFDTRTDTIWNRLLPFGYAAPRIGRLLEQSGGQLVTPPEGFVVLGVHGPLRDGELERAAEWARDLSG